MFGVSRCGSTTVTNSFKGKDMMLWVIVQVACTNIAKLPYSKITFQQIKFSKCYDILNDSVNYEILFFIVLADYSETQKNRKPMSVALLHELWACS